MDGKKTLALFGANGATGRRILREALDAGWRVRAMETGWPDGAPSHEHVEPRLCDLLSDPLAPAIEGCDAVVSAVGLPLTPETVIAPPPLYTEGALRMIKAMRTQGVKRLVVISAVFVDQPSGVPEWFRRSAGQALAQVYRQMGDMERILEAAHDIEWTAARAGWLLNEPKTGDYLVENLHLPKGVLRTRHGDLADFIVRTLHDDRWVRRKPAVGRRETLRHQSPPALLREFID